MAWKNLPSLGNEKPKIVRGEKNGNSRLTEANVREIRRRYAEGGVTQRQLASEYGVDRSLIGLVIQRKIWKHV